MTARQLLKNRIFLFILLFGMLEPRCVSELATLQGGFWTAWHRIDVVLIYLGTAFILVMYFYMLRKISLLSLAVILFQVWWIFSDLYNGLTDSLTIYADFRYAIQMISLVMLVELACKLNFRIQLLEILSFLLGLFIIINFVTILIFPNGMYIDSRSWNENWLFGYKNTHVYVYLLYMVCSALRDILKYGYLKLRYYFMVILMAAAALIANTNTTTVILIILALLILIFHNAKLPAWINSATAVVVSAIISVLMIVFSFQSNFSGVLEFFFGKGTALSGRVSIWSIALAKVAKNPVFGYGNDDVSTTLFRSWDVGQAHNFFLDILFVGGIVLMGLFVWIIYLTSSKLIRDESRTAKNIMIFVWIGYGILFLMESRRNDIYIYAVYAFTYYISYFNTKLNQPFTGISLNHKNIKIKFQLKN